MSAPNDILIHIREEIHSANVRRRSAIGYSNADGVTRRGWREHCAIVNRINRDNAAFMQTHRAGYSRTTEIKVKIAGGAHNAKYEILRDLCWKRAFVINPSRW